MGHFSNLFLNYLARVKRYSDHTRTAYRNDLRQFEEYLSESYGLHDAHLADAALIRSWLASLTENKMTRRTFNRKASCLRSFFSYLEQEGIVEKNPMLKIKSLKSEERLPVFLEEETMADLFSSCDFGPGWTGMRDQLMMELFYTTGIRLSELIQLRHGDTDTGSGLIRIHGKGNRQRIIPLLAHVSGLYVRYVEEKKKMVGAGDGNRLFLTDKGKQIYPVWVHRRVSRYLAQVSTKTRKSAHVIRHSFATHMLNRGADLNAIKELLGHSSLAATQVYTHNSIEKIKRVYKQAHPRA